MEWWTFAGARANATLAASLTAAGTKTHRFDNFCVTLADAGGSEASTAVHRLRAGETALVAPTVGDEAIAGLKFSACLPEYLARSVLSERATDQRAVSHVLTQAAVVGVQ